MNVTFVLPNFYGGGAQIVTVRLANWLSRNKPLQVCLVVLNGVGPVRELVGKEVQLVNLKVRRSSEAVVSLAITLRKLNPHIVISSLPHVSVAVLVSRAVGRGKYPVVVWERNIYRPAEHRQTSIKLRLLHLMVSRTYRYADGIIYNSPATEDSFRGSVVRLPSVSWILPNLIDVDSRAGATEKESLPERFLLGAGRLVFQKGFDVLLRSFSLIREANLYLVLAGEGPEELALKELALELGISERVRFLGYVSDVRLLMAKCEIFVLSSRWEGFGNVIVEALQEGAQVVSFDCPGGPRWILDNGKFGVLIKNGDGDALAKSLRQLITSGRSHGPEIVKARGDEYRASRVGNMFYTEVLRDTIFGARNVEGMA